MFFPAIHIFDTGKRPTRLLGVAGRVKKNKKDCYGAAEAAPYILSPGPKDIAVTSVPVVITPIVITSAWRTGGTRWTTGSTALALNELFKIITHRVTSFSIYQ